MKCVVIIGASGHGKVIADIIQKSGDQVIGFLDDNPKLSEKFIGFPMLGKINDYKAYSEHHEFIIAIGNTKIREHVAEKMDGVKWYTAIHPSAAIAGIDVFVEEGTAIMANAVVNSGSHIGKHCIINSGAVVEHDNDIGDYVHVSVGAKLAGTVHVGKSTWLGIGAIVSNNLNICSGCVIGAGCVVIRTIDEVGTYVGVPAERIKRMKNKNACSVSGGGGDN